MKRVTWLTDLHLDFLSSPAEIMALCKNIVISAPDYVLIGGDTGVAGSVKQYLLTLEEQLQLPIYFVLGNHDFYHSSIKQVRNTASDLSKTSKWLHWLPAEGVVELTAKTALIGHGSWADGRLGMGIKSKVLLNDYFLIEEFTGLSNRERYKTLNELGNAAAEHFREILPEALSSYQNVLLLTHVPPFRKACRHQGQISSDEYLPHFTCKAVGDVLVDIMKAHPESDLTVLCGHTHCQGEVGILQNLHVKTGGAEYGEPIIQEVIEVG